MWSGKRRTSQAGGVRTPRPPAPKLPPGAGADADIAADVFEPDERRRISDASSAPWRWIVKLTASFVSGVAEEGTGWFAGPRTIVTAGHCVARKSKYATAVNIQWAFDSAGVAQKSTTASSLGAADGWLHGEDASSDYGVVLLNDGIGVDDAFQFRALETQTLQQSDLDIAGYPLDRSPAGLYVASGSPSVVGPTLLRYEIDTSNGQSGSPIWTNLGGRFVVVGIHRSGGDPNMGLRLTAELIGAIEQWLSGDVA
jgi:V8-like Glu-specific endopeptidase